MARRKVKRRRRYIDNDSYVYSKVRRSHFGVDAFKELIPGVKVKKKNKTVTFTLPKTKYEKMFRESIEKPYVIVRVTADELRDIADEAEERGRSLNKDNKKLPKMCLAHVDSRVTLSVFHDTKLPRLKDRKKKSGKRKN